MNKVNMRINKTVNGKNIFKDQDNKEYAEIKIEAMPPLGDIVAGTKVSVRHTKYGKGHSISGCESTIRIKAANND